MKLNWHIQAARCAAAHPHWTWEQVCAAVGKRKRAKPVVEAPKKKPVQLTFNACL